MTIHYKRKTVKVEERTFPASAPPPHPRGVMGSANGLCIAPLLVGFFHPARLRLAILIISASSAVVLLFR